MHVTVMSVYTITKLQLQLKFFYMFNNGQLKAQALHFYKVRNLDNSLHCRYYGA